MAGAERKAVPVAVDGKALCGARTVDRQPRHVLSVEVPGLAAGLREVPDPGDRALPAGHAEPDPASCTRPRRTSSARSWVDTPAAAALVRTTSRVPRPARVSANHARAAACSACSTEPAST